MIRDRNRKLAAAGLLVLGALCLFVIYGNTVQGPFVFDDRPNIVEREELRLTRLTPSAVIGTFFWDNRGGRLHRPVSGLSFALNYYFGRHRVTGYHLVNILIHLLSALFLYKIMTLLLGLAATGLKPEDIVGTAVLATMLWAAHPLQSQAVAYIVQRMTSLAALFYLVGLWAYLRGRLALREHRPAVGVKWLLGALAAFLAGVFSKENASLFPVGLVLVEYFFFNGVEKVRRRPLMAIILVGILFLGPAIIGRLFGFIGGLDGLTAGYDLRSFTLKQRLLTEPRVLFFYISQLLYPEPGRFSLEHYFFLSDSLLSPPTTLAALLGLAGVLALGLGPGRKYPWIGFPIVFYFTHHLVEGTIIPLEIAYEHRNYLPSLFFFLPAAVLLVRGIRYYGMRRQSMSLLLALFLGLMLFFFGLATHLRNMDWRTEKSLWRSAVRVAPEMCRPWQGLAECYTAGPDRNLDRARALFRAGIEKEPGNYIFERALLWEEVAKTFQENGQWLQAEKALHNSLTDFQEKIARNPALSQKNQVKKQLSRIYHRLSHLAVRSDLELALSYIDQAAAYYQSVEYDIARALYLHRSGDYQQGLRFLQRVIEKYSRQWTIHFALGHMLTFAGELDRGYWFYKRAWDLASFHQVEPTQYQSLLLYLAENRRLAGADVRSREYLSAYVDGIDFYDLQELVRRHTTFTPGCYPLIDTSLMLHRVRDGLCRSGRGCS